MILKRFLSQDKKTPDRRDTLLKKGIHASRDASAENEQFKLKRLMESLILAQDERWRHA